ncbi:hypothetical protein DFAR_1180013 [Desulfarculales bacterium]
MGLAWREDAAGTPLLGRDYLVDKIGMRVADGAPAVFTHRIVLA